MQGFSMNILCSPDISKVTWCMEHALTAQHPQTRYGAGWDAKFFWIPLSYLPSFVSDFIVHMLLPSPKDKTSSWIKDGYTQCKKHALSVYWHSLEGWKYPGNDYFLKFWAMHCNFVDFPTWVIVLDLNFFHYFFVDKGKFSRAIFSQQFWLQAASESALLFNFKQWQRNDCPCHFMLPNEEILNIVVSQKPGLLNI